MDTSRLDDSAMLPRDLAARPTAPATPSPDFSWTDIALKVVPIAAIAAATLIVILAGFNAQRQERGRRRAADLDMLQLVVLAFRSQAGDAEHGMVRRRP
ncbi:hypothetical protein ACIQZN_26610 [Streptomyces sp. NPDC097595]|uniref:hypothetical protein n=1 Tax=Streptomyces sp. NPDC097595 TaxID=3366090 RepID=UPI0038088920